MIKSVSIANIVNNVFISIAEIFAEIAFRNFVSSEINFSFIITSTNMEQIYQIISLNINKLCGPNNIPAKVLHLLQDQI